jgi:hypothetical protein
MILPILDQTPTTILSLAIGMAVRAQAVSLPLFSTCAAATRCQAPLEMEWTQTSIRPKDRYRYVAYSTP